MTSVYALLLSLAAATGAWGQAEVPGQPPPSVVDCSLCHTSDSPTKEKPSLVNCPRFKTKGVHSPKQAPRTLTLGEAGKEYGPVKFSHKAHAEMAEMGGGCYRCHHYDQGGRIQKCGGCHAAARARDDLGKPDLKGALHRLCVECHRQWGGSTDCGTCHGSTALPRVEVPGRVVYETSYGQGKVVTFLHGDHARRFGLKCADCHQQQTCASCHDLNNKGSGAPPRGAKGPDPMKTAHRACSSCHAKDRCDSCHSSKPMDSFDHGKRTGWIHNRFHRRLECARCHSTAGPFKRLDTGCVSCHPKDWQATFDHKKTGLALDETHSTLGCESCHGDKEFMKPPECSACHDRSYPKDRPGKLVGG